jgi:tetratricopeptide (TPR) repeat protein
MRSAAPSTRHLALALIGLIGLTPACKGKSSRPPEAGAGAATAMGNWAQWRDLSPLLDVARTHAPKPTITAIERARDHLRAGKPLAAERALAQLADSEGRDWIAAARGDLAALYFSTCIRGVAWRIPESVEAVQGRTIDFTEGAKVAPTDLAIEPLLVALDQAVEAKVPALALHARIARARVTAYVSRCAPNEQVARLAQGMVKGDLAQLAAEGHLTPDLAYLWGGIQLTEYSASAARPFLLQAREAGFDDPALLYLLAVVALEQRALEQADAYAREALAAYKSQKDPDQEAQTAFLQGEIASARADKAAARRAYEAALARVPAHSAALLALARLLLDTEGEPAAVTAIAAHLGAILGAGPLSPEAARKASEELESLVILISEPPVALLCRGALLDGVDSEPEPLRRGLRYFYAATLDIRLGEFQAARGHAILARDELAEAPGDPPVDIGELLRNLDALQ